MQHADSVTSKLMASLRQYISHTTFGKARDIIQELAKVFGDETSLMTTIDASHADVQTYSNAVRAIRHRAKDLLLVAASIEDLGIAPSSTIRNIKIDETLMAGDSVPISIPNEELVRFFLEDVHECIAASVREVCRLPRPHPLPGILTLSVDAMEKGNSYNNSTIRKRLVLV
jgi:hypothetical protein